MKKAKGVLLSRQLAGEVRDMVRERRVGAVSMQSHGVPMADAPQLAFAEETIPAGEVGDATLVGLDVDVRVYSRNSASSGYFPVFWSSGDEVSAEDDDLADGEKPRRGQWENFNGGGAARIRFTILATDFTIGNGALGCDHVVASVTHVSCGGAGVKVGDEVKIYDPEYCHFNLPIDLLVGLSGTATKMDSSSYQEGLDYVLYCLQEIRDGGCIWMIDTLCCAEEEYINV